MILEYTYQMESHQNVIIFLLFSQKTKETKDGPQKVVIFLQLSPKNKKHKDLREDRG